VTRQAGGRQAKKSKTTENEKIKIKNRKTNKNHGIPSMFDVPVLFLNEKKER
jgi:hypothetical protein